MYTFKSDSLYFPLKISSLAEGVTSINLFTITYDKPETAEFSAIKFEEPVQFTLTSKDLLDIDERIAELFKSTTWLTAASYDGNLDDLSFDLKVRVLNETRIMYQRLEEMKVKIETMNNKIGTLEKKLTDLTRKLTDLTDLTEKRLNDLTLEIQKTQKASLTWVMIGIVIGVLVATFLFKGSKRI